MLANKSDRLQVIGGLLEKFGLNLEAGLKASDPKPFLDALWHWTASDWPSIHDPSMTHAEIWQRSIRDGPEIAFSLIMDLAIVFGEIVLVHRSDYKWALDLDPENRADGMDTWQKPILLRRADEVVPEIQHDFEGSAYACYVNCTRPTYSLLNDSSLGVIDALSRAHEHIWHERSARRTIRSEE